MPGNEEILDTVIRLSTQLWIAANRIAGYALVNLLDEPALLAMAFC